MIRDFIHDLGGPKETAQALRARGHDVTEKAICAWGIRDTVPWKWRESLAEVAIHKGLPIESMPEDVRRFLPVEAAE